MSTFVQLFEIHINVFHLQSPEFFKIQMFSRTSCSSPGASERPQHQQLRKPQFPAGHTEVVGRPSSQWGVSSENFPLDHRYCLFCGRRHVNMTSNWKKNPPANNLNMSATTHQLRYPSATWGDWHWARSSSSPGCPPQEYVLPSAGTSS